MLSYTANRLLEAKRAQIVRDQGTADEFGAETAPDWQPLASVRCAFWWWRESARGPAKLFATPQREIAQSDGGMLLPAGTDVTENDRIAQITDTDGNVLVHGPFDIVAIFNEPGQPLIELAWKKATEARLTS